MCRWHLSFAQVAVAAQQEGIEYIGMRNEQAACYAAQVTLSETYRILHPRIEQLIVYLTFSPTDMIYVIPLSNGKAWGHLTGWVLGS